MNLAEALPANTRRSISSAELQQARTEAARSRRRFTEVLEAQLGLEPAEFVSALAGTFRYSVLRAGDLQTLSPAFDVVAYAKAMEQECLALRDTDGRLLLVISDPFVPALQAWAEEHIREPFTWRLTHRAEIVAFLARHEETLRAMDSLLPAIDTAGGSGLAVEHLSIKTIIEDTSPVVRLVHSTIYDALKSGASDIHLESSSTGLAIKYRIDGVLTHVGAVEVHDQAEQVISRIKVMSELDIAERRIPQDGRFKVAVRGREVDFRVSIMPSIFGEDAVLRILDKQAISDQIKGLRLDYLGLDAETIASIRHLSSEPYGMVLVTGPTGSGKTTTLYAAITEINHGQDKIITIEDPVEYQLPGVLQIPVNEKKGLTFARGLRSILRHDPDKIMVGEIRDSETAQIAVQSALTGHLVFTTVHANNIFDVIGRFIHMGVEPYSFVSALNGIVAQRLVRLICRECGEPHIPDPALLSASGITLEQAGEFRFCLGRGCGHCRGTGYKGRKAIAEILYLNDEIRELIIGREPVRRLKEAARHHGTRFLRETAINLVRNGETTLQEINRVTFVA
jgi:general secretion pathway protein E